ncbi:cystathionine gamma-lyase [Geodermatophilus sp. Leaf369]|uniref:cystathionine gamma-lyase n=1 Tax=Geodermatophilus sp. Leaf369 TaxID=1736354 RepID=UPI0006F7A392|nr:cystathionine gamma-lyase [Geodermatophilus sp. Leaf369]KQS57872.1 cystathionine gamma-lyase [Geodermatophilus sp. Leaf369]QNG35784.1 cystathionine gamma-lyase [Geodermatophilaceae bacterium NBWT11]
MSSWSDGTRVVRGGDGPVVPGAPLRPSPVFAAPYHLGEDPYAADFYARPGHPTLRVFEEAVGDLDGGDCLAFATGMAAISAAVFAVVGAGDRIVIPSDGYYQTRALSTGELARFGVQVDQVPTLEIAEVAARGDLEGAAFVLLETPSNPELDVCDIAAVAAATQAAGAVLAVDNTTATPLGQRPLELGADITLGADTKALTGHSDLLMGHVSTARTERGRELQTRLKAWRDRTGNGPGAFDAWLAHRSMSTLDLRLTRQATTAAAVAELLAAHPAATGVRWPGRPGDPSHELASRQMLRMNGVVSATLADEAAVHALVRHSELWLAATSFGGVHSTVDRRAQWGGDAVPDGFVRFSCGIEDTADLVADLTAALDALR